MTYDFRSTLVRKAWPLIQGTKKASISITGAEPPGWSTRNLRQPEIKRKAAAGDETIIRCGITKFQERDGTLVAQSLTPDTDSVLITGASQIHLDSETLDLVVRGSDRCLPFSRACSSSRSPSSSWVPLVVVRVMYPSDCGVII